MRGTTSLSAEHIPSNDSCEFAISGPFTVGKRRQPAHDSSAWCARRTGVET